MKILGLISSLNDPASRFRILQYKKHFESEGHILNYKTYKLLRESDPPLWFHKINKFTTINEWRSWDFIKQFSRIPSAFKQISHDIIWQNRLAIPHHSFNEKLFFKPFVFDFDDAIWLTEGEKSFEKAVQKATLTIAGNEYLAAKASGHTNNIKIIPTTVDTEIFKPLHLPSSHFTIGWIGTTSNHKYLEIIKGPILEFLKRNANARLMIVSDKPPEVFIYDNERVIFKKWIAERENEFINQFTIGIMPLEDNDWTRGKCSYKMLQYLACGKPAIVSPVGMNNKILGEAETSIAASGDSQWLKAFDKLKKDPSLYTEYARNGINLVNQRYSCANWASVLLEYFKKFV